MSRPNKFSHYDICLQNYLRIDKYPKPCSFLRGKKGRESKRERERKLLSLEAKIFIFFNSVEMHFSISGNCFNYFLKSLKISQST